MVAVALWAAVALAQQSPPKPAPAKETYEITGVVVNAVTGEPVPGAVISVSPTGFSRPRMFPRRALNPGASDDHTTRTGSDGSFSFAGLSAGKYSLTAFHHGFPRQAFEQHEQYSSAIVVGPDKQSTGIRFRLQPDATLSGTIIDEHNEAVANAQVQLFRRGIQNGKAGVYRDQATNSNDQGYYHFAHLRKGQYYLVVSAMPWYTEGARFGFARVRTGPGRLGGTYYSGTPVDTSNPAFDVAFPLTFYPGVTDSGSAEPIQLTPGQQETADFNLAAVPSLHVRVHSVSGTQQNPTSLEREVFGNAIFGGTRVSYEQGVTDISGITAGRYLLQIHPVGNNQEAGPPIPAQREIDITGDMDINAGDMPAGVNVTGTLQFQGPAPSTDTRLMLRRNGILPIPLSVSNSGQISSERPVPPDEYDLFLPISNFQLTHLQVTGGKLDGQTIDVGSDDIHLALEAAKSSARISGVALKSDQPLPGVMVVLVPQDLSRPLLYRRDQSDSDGSFELSAIPPGTYTLIAIENGWDLEWSKPAIIRPFLAAGNVVRVAIDGEYHVDVKVQAGPAKAR